MKLPWYKKPRAKRVIRALVAALVGAVIGMTCQFLPESLQKPCHLAAKLCGLAGGH